MTAKTDRAWFAIPDGKWIDPAKWRNGLPVWAEGRCLGIGVALELVVRPSVECGHCGQEHAVRAMVIEFTPLPPAVDVGFWPWGFRR